MIERWFFSFERDPILKHEITFSELITELGNDEVYKGTSVDTATQSSLNDFFAFDRLCDKKSKFLWYWRRRLNLYYPIYKQELEMWEERKLEKWFYDNWKDETVTHDGTFALDETTKQELKRELTTTIKSVFSSKSTGETTSNTKNIHSGEYENSSSGESDSTTANKNRAFTFNYPESNYQGGVIPYDIDNNPDVEFIDSQADSIRKSQTHETHSDSGNGTDSATDTGTATGTSKGTTDSTTNNTQATTEGQTVDGSRDQDTTTHWTETKRRQSDNINKLATELIEQLPTTNFFLKFVKQLSICFETVRLEDEEREDLRE